MYSYQKIFVLKCCASLLSVGALAVTLLATQSTHAFAAACARNTPLSAGAGSATCGMSITIVVVNRGKLISTNTAVAPGIPITSPGSSIVSPFTFTTVTKDHRGLALGWVLSAASAGIVNGMTTLPLSLTGKDIASSCTNGTCPPTTFTPIILTTTTARFLTVGDTSHTLATDGDYSNKTDGTFTVPADSPLGIYTGIISITLLNTF